MRFCSYRGRFFGTSAAAVFAALLLPCEAFPPAPGFTVFGTIRDPYGWVVDTPGSKVIFKDVVSGDEIARTSIGSGKLDENYRIMLPLDQKRSGADYKEGAISEATPFSIEVLIDGITYLPIETVAAPVEGASPAEVVRLDLGLGQDSDADGLPDQWEQWQLEGAGLQATDLSLIDGAGDLDGDGLTNYQEYLAGTFAYLFIENLNLEIMDLGQDGWNTLEFLAVVDKTYIIEESTDLVTWTESEFSVSTDRSALVSDWKAPDTVRQTVQTLSSQQGTFYRLGVQ